MSYRTSLHLLFHRHFRIFDNAFVLILLSVFIRLPVHGQFQEDTPCNETHYLNATLEKQYVTTPYYNTSEDYPGNMHCSYILKTIHDDQRISVIIEDMDMEQQIFSNCLDYTSVYDGSPMRVQLPLLKVCGTDDDLYATSTGDTVTIEFVSDNHFEARGAKISYQAVPLNQCDPNWVDVSGNCYRLFENHQLDWSSAQEFCAAQQANLVPIKTDAQYNDLKENFGHIARTIWTGHSDTANEDVFVYLNEKPDKAYPPLEKVSTNTGLYDCLYVAFNIPFSLPFLAGDCRIKMDFICHKMSNWTTVPIKANRERVRNGAVEIAPDYSRYILALVSLILLLIIFCICFRACKRKQNNQVHNTESNRMVQGIETTDPYTPAPPVPPSASRDVITRQPPVPKTAPPMQPVLTPPRTAEPPVEVVVANNRPLPPLLEPHQSARIDELPRKAESRLSNEREEAERKKQQEETSILVPQPAPRSLPPLPLRENTYHTMRDDSFLRSKRVGELFDRPRVEVLDNISAISLDEFWSNSKKKQEESEDKKDPD